jgi:hypothetical protein
MSQVILGAAASSQFCSFDPYVCKHQPPLPISTLCQPRGLAASPGACRIVRL